MKCFYHKSDLDGHCSGAIVFNEDNKCEMIGVDYNDCLDNMELSWDDENEDIFVVDFRFSIEDMEWLNNNTALHWIDHHKTSIDEAHESKFLASGGQLLVIGRAGCELTWEYLHPNTDIPMVVTLLGRYDVWDHKDPRVLPFQYGMRNIKPTHPAAIVWPDLFHDALDYNKIIERGQIILDYQDGENAKYSESMSYEADFEGLRAIVMNKAFANSKAFDAVYDDSRHDIMIMYGMKPGEVKYSIYTVKPDIDVSEIAKKYGGGGHRGAAGFYSKEVII